MWVVVLGTMSNVQYLPLQKESLVKVQSQLPTLDAVVAADKKVLALSICCCVLSSMLSMTAKYLYLDLSLHGWRCSKCRLKDALPLAYPHLEMYGFSIPALP